MPGPLTGTTVLRALPHFKFQLCHCLSVTNVEHHYKSPLVSLAYILITNPPRFIQDKESPIQLWTFLMGMLPKALSPTTKCITRPHWEKKGRPLCGTRSSVCLTFYVIIELTAQEPSPRVTGDHVCCNKSGWEKAGHICPVASNVECFSMEVGCMNIDFIAHSKEMPWNVIPSTHRQHREIPKHKAINSWKNKQVKNQRSEEVPSELVPAADNTDRFEGQTYPELILFFWRAQFQKSFPNMKHIQNLQTTKKGSLKPKIRSK